MSEKKELIVLGIETSCDDTAVGIVTSGKKVLANVVYNQFKEHSPYGGVVPEIAARAHVDHLDEMVKKALKEAGLALADIDAFAATAGPGLVGGLMVGIVSAKTFSLATGKPFLAINHLEGHALSPRLVSEIPFPYLLLLISGGHCQLLSVEGLGKYRRLGTTIDDAAGEAFDKGAKLLGLGVPGGPNLEKAAKSGNPKRFKFPRPLIRKPGCDFSFSGLKTALLLKVEELAKNGENPEAGLIADLAASYQAAIVDCLENRTRNAMEDFKAQVDGKLYFVIAGGVAANTLIREKLEGLSKIQGFSYFAPPPWLCTDNGVMIAWAGIEKFKLNKGDPLDTSVRARWPLDETASPVIGHGRRGVKV